MQYYEDFSKWLEKYLQQLPSEIIAVNFNLYEGSNQTYDIQLIGSDEFDETDEDGVCGEIFTTGEDIFFILRNKDVVDWVDGLSLIIKMVEEYLSSGRCAYILKRLQAVGVGFVDGDIEIVYQAK